MKKGFLQIQWPGAEHHPPCHIHYEDGSSSLATISLDEEEKRVHFVVFVYLRAWFSASFLESAASDDIRLLHSLQKYKSVDRVSAITTTVLNRHTWYLTEEQIPLSLFDKDLPLELRSLLAARIGQKTLGAIQVETWKFVWLLLSVMNVN